MPLTNDVSILEFYGENERYRCGYCKSSDTNYSDGMWAHGLTVQDYQDLIDRGWRRSGCYCYKPTMHLTCCPMYTIKCSALEFRLSKSQKKKLKRVHAFLAHGRKKSEMTDDGTNESVSDMESGDDAGPDCGLSDMPGLNEKAERAKLNLASTVINSVDDALKERLIAEEGVRRLPLDNTLPSNSENLILVNDKGKETQEPVKSSVKKLTRPGEGMDPNRPQCKKAKLLRQERKEKKLAQLGSSSLSVSEKTKSTPPAKTLEDFINEPLPESPAHRLEIRLVRSSPESKEFKSTFNAALEVYQRYQTTIHNDPLEKVSERQFRRFLVNSPLKPWKPSDGPSQGYGSFHQQYWLDGRLLAVGVIDILPRCISSVYFFYDPEFHFLTLGTYGSLREIAFCRTLHHSAPSLQYYYMGFYIHSCPKMRYKGAFSPSFLLCPEVYSWHPLESCLPLLERTKYCRFNPDPKVHDPDQLVGIGDVSVLFLNKAMAYSTFSTLNPANQHQEEVTKYASLVGNKLSRRMLLILMF
uniref:Arginyl-tRNA--protein transferase 1 n=1 Tax=Homalodisca liturata TaxID=320908 RepID=A0A1B6IE36_9HEMI